MLVAAGVMCAVSGCKKQPAAQLANQEIAVERGNPSVPREASVSSQPAVQKQKVAGHDGDVRGKALMAENSDVDAESEVRAVEDAVKELMTDKAAAFAEHDPVGGLAWATNLTSPAQRDYALESLAWACTTTHLGVSVEALEQLPPGAARSRLVAQVAGQWAARNPDDAQSWAENRPDAAESAVALEAFAIAIAEAYPVRAATIVVDQMEAGSAQDRTVVAVIQRWVQTDRNAATQWISQFPNSPLKAAAVAVITRTIPPDPPPVPTQISAEASHSR